MNDNNYYTCEICGVGIYRNKLGIEPFVSNHKPTCNMCDEIVIGLNHLCNYPYYVLIQVITYLNLHNNKHVKRLAKAIHEIEDDK